MSEKEQVNREIEFFLNGLVKFSVVLEKNRIKSLVPVIGFHYRGIEKICEKENENKVIEYLARINPENPFIYAIAGAIALERIREITVPEKVEYSRVLAIELLRVKNHFITLKDLFCDINLKKLRDEFAKKIIAIETIIDSLFADPFNFIKVGGISYALQDSLLSNLEPFFDSIYDFCRQKKIEFEKSHYIARKLKNIGIIKKEEAIYLCGVNARASGINLDLRIDKKIPMYGRFDFLRTIVHGGSAYDRARIRFDEIKQSIVIIKQAIRQMPIGEISTEGGKRVEEGDAYVEIEGNSFAAGVYIEMKNEIVHRVRVCQGGVNILPIIGKLAEGLSLPEFNIFIHSLHLSVADIDK